jgi:hypothetical protein
MSSATRSVMCTGSLALIAGRYRNDDGVWNAA